VTLSNNIVKANLGGSVETQGCTFAYSNVAGGTDTNIDVPPDFVDTSTKNFSLKTTSQCIDKGTANPHSDIDITGGPRLKGSAVDLGAFEVQ
jgi:hypothetical protein